MDTGQVTIFVLSIGIMLLAAKLLGELFVLIKQPAIIGEILAGIVLGPTVFGMIAPETFNTLFTADAEIGIALEGITTVAVILLLLVSGLEVDLSIVLKQGKAAVSTGMMGIIVPFALGFGVSYLFPGLMGIQNEEMRFIFALFMGTALSISALPVIAKTLMDLNIFKSEIGYIIISAAMLNDLLGWLIFSIILGMIGQEGHGFGFGITLLLIISFSLLALTLGKKIINRIVPFVQNKLSYPGGILNFILILGFLSAAFTEYIGVHAIFGAFIIGIAIGSSVYLKEETRELITQFVTNIFAPLFFVSIGLRVNFFASFDIVIVLIVLLLAFAGKVIGCGIGARIGGLSKSDSLAVGFGMNSRGAMEIILGILALQFGLIQETVFVALVIMALLTSMASAPFMTYFLRGKKRLSLNNLLMEDNIIFTTEPDKKKLFEKMVMNLGLKNREEIVETLMERETDNPTGISNYLAVPHARIKGDKPYAAIAVHSDGLNFSSFDGTPAKVIVMLLTPEKDDEQQLKLLAQTAAKFSSREKVEELLESNDREEFLSTFKKL